MKNLYRVLVVVMALFSLQIAKAQSVFINEIHYDNASTDVDEAIELAGPAGTDLTNWSIVLYNGSNSSVYNTTVLSGSLSDLGNGFGTLIQTYPSNGIQNGSPDGVALIDDLGNVVQFLSYEGEITAVGGPADGLTSEDIVVTESSATPAGNSLQLMGEGTTYTDFTWAADTTSTYDNVNVGQSFGAAMANLVINEIDADNPSTDAAEFIELYDGGVGNTLLDGFVVVLYNGSNNQSYNTIDLTGLSTDADGYFVIGSANVANVDLASFTTNGLQNGADAVALYQAQASSFPNGSEVTLDSLVDAIVYGTNDADDAELLALLNAGESQLNEDVNGDKDNESLQRIPNGEGGVRNTSSYAAALPTPGAPNSLVVEPPVATILINEIDADNTGTDAAEFIELYDGGTGNTALDGWVVVLYNGSNNTSYNTIDLAGQVTDADGYFVIGSATVPNVDLEAFTTNGLQNGADAVALYQADASNFPSGTAVTLDSLVDAVVYGTNDADDAELLVLLNAGEAQLNEDVNGDKDNQSLQRIPNGEGGLRNTAGYAATTPTPGAANSLDVPVADFVVINEIDVDQASTDAAEFIELYDGGVGNTALDGLVIVLFNGNGDASYNSIDLAGQSTDAEGYFVLGSSTVPNVDLAGFTTNGLQNGADAIALYKGDALSFPNGTAATSVDLIDAIVYGTSDADDVELLAALTPGQAQVDENEGGNGQTQSLQRVPNGSGGQLNTTAYAAANPTPGASNDGIPPSGDIITIAEARAAAVGTPVTIQGVITASDQFGGPAYIQDSTAGIPIFDATIHGDGAFNIGDVLTVSAQVSEFQLQKQLGSVSAVELIATDSVVAPTQITLAELSAFEGQLVSIVGVSFPTPNDLIFGNSNITVSDASGTAELRVDGDVADLVGKVQPVICDVVGVIGSFQGSPQLLPRFEADLPCAGTFVPPTGTGASDITLDVVTWNIEWFGNISNGPSPESTQKTEAQAVIDSLDADLYAFQEISDEALLQQIADDLPEYELVVNVANVSAPPNQPGVSQKLAFLYKTSVITPIETKGLLESIHPAYNGGDASALVGYPDPNPSRFYASGRLPFLMTADVSVNGVTERVNFVNIHARANNSNDAQGRYEMRRYDVTVLKDSLDAFYADQKVILLGDYNDDVDETVANVNTTLTSFDAFVNDPDNYAIKTVALSNAGFRSFAFNDDMIDHIAITNELFDNYIEGSEIVHYEFFDADYANTTSDHFPVSASFNFEQEITFNDFTAVEVVSFNQGRKRSGRRVHPFRSNPNKALGRPLENYYFNFVSLGFGGEIVLKLDNFMYDLPGDEFKVFESTFGHWNIPCYYYPEKAEVSVSEDGVEFTSLGVACQDGKFDLASGGVEKALFVKIKDVSNRRNFGWFADGYDLDGIYNLIPEPKAGVRQAAPEDKGSFVPDEEGEFQISTYPNPFTDYIELELFSEGSSAVSVKVFNTLGKEVYTTELSVSEGYQNNRIELGSLKSGVYLMKIDNAELDLHQTVKIIKE